MMSLEQLLTARFGVAETDLAKAKEFQQKYAGRLEHILVNMGGLDEDVLTELYAEYLELNKVDATELEDAVAWLPGDEIQLKLVHQLAAQHWFCLMLPDQQVQVLCVDPLNVAAHQLLQQLGDYPLVLANKALLASFAEQFDIPQQNAADDPALTNLEEAKLRELAQEAPVVNLFNSLVGKAMKVRASDMHIEPVNGRLRVRFRVDGVLHSEEFVAASLQLALVTRLKILSGMDIAEKRRPQDGKINFKIAQEELDIRVSALPLQQGESIVMRFLRKEALKFDLAVLGIETDTVQLIEEDIRKTAGVILLTGPTGSGKTTSLYSFLSQLNSDEVKIITLEDPVEYQLDGINQVQVNSDIGFSFSAGLRSVVRQDPDIIMVGEIRDVETARIAMQSALTGHLVFSTVHTNDAPSAYTRLLDLGVEEFLLDAALVSIIAQRLARTLCSACAEPLVTEEADFYQKKYQLDQLAQRQGLAGFKLKQPKGCPHCNNTGYKGRVALVEYLRCDDAIRMLPKDPQFLQQAKAVNKARGARTLLEDGLLKAIKGQTDIAEVLRVAG
ncbi:GspE/PulE family protein [Rheinheimera sp.]|uniref:GspE/PulE family protein n=1 Tax=Rheinheimera sp. TaxID=1869214 RepID=UPI003AF98F70